MRRTSRPARSSSKPTQIKRALRPSRPEPKLAHGDYFGGTWPKKTLSSDRHQKRRLLIPKRPILPSSIHDGVSVVRARKKFDRSLAALGRGRSHTVRPGRESEIHGRPKLQWRGSSKWRYIRPSEVREGSATVKFGIRATLKHPNERHFVTSRRTLARQLRRGRPSHAGLSLRQPGGG